MQTQHVPVMLAEVLKFLQPHPEGRYIDGTVGGGGHTQAILEQSAPTGRVLGIDTDVEALARVRQRLTELVSSGRLVLAHGNFAEQCLAQKCAGIGHQVDEEKQADQQRDRSPLVRLDVGVESVGGH